jgi:hypothetical protein
MSRSKGDIYDNFDAEEAGDYDINAADRDYQDYIYNLYRTGALVPRGDVAPEDMYGEDVSDSSDEEPDDDIPEDYGEYDDDE